eukprot:11552065-Alexandrium_andersonii.AAC.1
MDPPEGASKLMRLLARTASACLLVGSTCRMKRRGRSGTSQRFARHPVWKTTTGWWAPGALQTER